MIIRHSAGEHTINIHEIQIYYLSLFSFAFESFFLGSSWKNIVSDLSFKTGRINNNEWINLTKINATNFKKQFIQA